jgi:hypothetical protein
MTEYFLCTDWTFDSCEFGISWDDGKFTYIGTGSGVLHFPAALRELILATQALQTGLQHARTTTSLAKRDH